MDEWAWFQKSSSERTCHRQVFQKDCASFQRRSSNLYDNNLCIIWERSLLVFLEGLFFPPVFPSANPPTWDLMIWNPVSEISALLIVSTGVAKSMGRMDRDHVGYHPQCWSRRSAPLLLGEQYPTRDWYLQLLSCCRNVPRRRSAAKLMGNSFKWSKQICPCCQLCSLELDRNQHLCNSIFFFRCFYNLMNEIMQSWTVIVSC